VTLSTVNDGALKLGEKGSVKDEIRGETNKIRRKNGKT
jgi:hypothetical protein